MKKNEGKIGSIIIIVIGLFLCLFVLGFWRRDTNYGLISYRETLKLPCGVTIYGPEENEKVDLPIRVHGFANGCGWELENGVVGTVEVLAPNGIVLYRNELPKNQKDNKYPVYFEKDLDFRIPLGYKHATVILKNNKLGIYKNIVQIPVVFK